MPDILKRVRNGAALLDRARPGWENELRAGSIEINSLSHCVVGQLYGDFRLAINDPDLVRAAREMQETRPSAYGFAFYYEEGPLAIQALNLAWSFLVLRRRARAVFHRMSLRATREAA